MPTVELPRFAWLRDFAVLERFYVRNELVDILCGRIPRAHEARTAFADERVEHPTPIPKSFDEVLWQLGEDRISLAREKNFDFRNGAQLSLETARHLIGVGGMPKPRPVLKDADPRRGEKTHLRGELAGLFAAVIEFESQLLVKEDDRFPQGNAILRPAEAKDIDPCLPRNFLRRNVKGCNRVREPSAVHVQPQTEFAAHLPHGAHFGRRINGAQLRRLRHADSAWFWIVNIAA